MVGKWGDLRRLVADVSPRGPRFNSMPFHMGFLMDKMALKRLFSE
jgi:hypothetical protein